MTTHELDLAPSPARASILLLIIMWVMWIGLVFFPLAYMGAIAVIIQHPHAGDTFEPVPPILQMIWVCWVAIGIGGATIARWILHRKMSKSRPNGFVGVYFGATVVWWCLIEGATLFGLTLCVLGRDFSWYWVLILSLVGLIAVSFPKRKLLTRRTPEANR